MSSMRVAQSKWQAVKPMVIALAIGLVAGPMITNYLGWQVSSGAARTEVRENVLDQVASICAARARAEVAGAASLDWNARSELAKKWATAPTAPFADLDVGSACAQKLAA